MRCLGILLLVLSLSSCASSCASSRAGEPEPPGPAVPRPVQVLHDWDARRSAAWARGDAASLSGLYVAGSSAGARDVRLLRRYRERGLRVSMRTQVLSTAILVDRPRLVRLRVTDRVLVRVEEQSLPRDAAQTRVLELRRVSGEWLMASVRPVPSSGSP